MRPDENVDGIDLQQPEPLDYPAQATPIPGALGAVFGAGLFGLMLGALIGGPLADRIGRKRVIILSTLAFGLCSLLTVTADSLNSLLLWRLATGLGLGGAMPNAIALTSEYS